jgi:rubrerythrin
MPENTTDTKEMLLQAIRSEIDGRKFYTYLAEQATNDEAKRKLTNLAEDEIRHEEALINIYKKVYGGEEPVIPEEGVGVLSKFFRNPDGREGLTEMQYIDMAIEAELAATNYYKEGAKTAPTDEIKKIYEGMAAEEFNHYELLQAEKSALGDNYYWFGFGDGSPMEE